MIKKLLIFCVLCVCLGCNIKTQYCTITFYPKNKTPVVYKHCSSVAYLIDGVRFHSDGKKIHLIGEGIVVEEE